MRGYAEKRLNRYDFENFANELYYKFDEWAREIYDMEEYTDDECDVISECCSNCADMVETLARAYNVEIYKGAYKGDE